MTICELTKREFLASLGYLDAGATDKVLQLVCLRYGVTLTELKGKDRSEQVAFIRQIAMYLLRMETPMSLGEVGGKLGGRTPATCSYGFQKIAGMIEESPGLRRKIERIREEL